MITSLQQKHGATDFLRLGVKDLDPKPKRFERLELFERFELAAGICRIHSSSRSLQ
jgi:hypothetical protein